MSGAHEIYTVGDPELFDLYRENVLDESIKELLASPPRLRHQILLSRQLALGIFELRIFTKAWCSRFIEELNRFQSWSSQRGHCISRPNSMNNYGVILDQMGISSFIDKVVNEIIRPISSLLFFREGGAMLDSHHAFTVEYEADGDKKLGFHVDDSQVTMNLCLGTSSFSGAEVYFRGQRCFKHVDTKPFKNEEVSEEFTYDSIPGIAILHAGKNRHGVFPLTAGHRINLIVWCRSSVVREAESRKHFLQYSEVVLTEGEEHNIISEGNYAPYCATCQVLAAESSTAWTKIYDCAL